MRYNVKVSSHITFLLTKDCNFCSLIMWPFHVQKDMYLKELRIPHIMHYATIGITFIYLILKFFVFVSVV